MQKCMKTCIISLQSQDLHGYFRLQNSFASIPHECVLHVNWKDFKYFCITLCKVYSNSWNSGSNTFMHIAHIKWNIPENAYEERERERVK